MNLTRVHCAFPRPHAVPAISGVWITSADDAAAVFDPLMKAGGIEAWAYATIQPVRIIQVKVAGQWVRLRQDGKPYLRQEAA